MSDSSSGGPTWTTPVDEICTTCHTRTPHPSRHHGACRVDDLPLETLVRTTEDRSRRELFSDPKTVGPVGSLSLVSNSL